MSDPLDNKRRSQRRRVLKGGVVAFNDRRSTLPCTIRNISSSGARLHVDSSIDAPDTFVLIIDLDGIEADCQVVWRKMQELAVAFVGPPRTVPPKRTQVVAALVPESTPSLRRKPRSATS